MLRKKLKIASEPLDLTFKINQEDSLQTSPIITSHFFTSPDKKIWLRLYEIECKLNASLSLQDFKLNNPNISAVYNPTEYARNLHCQYLEKYVGDIPKKILFIGMNPGPWGMCQTGVLTFIMATHIY